MKRICCAKPSITNREVEYVTDAVKTSFGETSYAYIKKFEDKFREYLGSKFSIATSSCTGAITLALASIGIKSLDEVILPEITWVASVAPVVNLGARPIFVDVLPDSWCIDHTKIENAIGPKTKAIIAVHVYGNLCEMDEIMEIAKKHNLYVIEDAAEAFGSEYKGKKAGSIADFGVFSFHGTKTCTTGEGGMLVTNKKEFFEKAAILNDHGRNPKIKKMFYPEIIGYKFKMSNLQAAMGLAQIERVEELVNKQRENFYEYKKNLSDVPGISLNPEPNYIKNSFWFPTIVFDKSLNINREKLIDFFKEKNVDIRTFFYPLSSLPMFEEKKENVVSYDIYSRGINLPSYYDLNKEDILFICNCLKEFIFANNHFEGI